MNLVGNALKFTPADGLVHIEVIVGPGENESALIRFAVRDTGIGIAPEGQKRLFEPFSQADAATTRRFGGTGLGLSICKQLITLMGGAIGVESVAGHGACFWFSIPFAQSNGAQPIRAPSPRNDNERRATVRPRTERILLVDDNDVNAVLAKLQFKRLGFEVTTASNGREACRAVQAERYDLIFMDCHMPEMDGFEATKTSANSKPERRDTCRSWR